MTSGSCCRINYLLYTISISLLAAVFCVIPESVESDSQSITRIGNDTITPYGQLVFTFSRPLEEDQIPCLEFSPHFFSFSYRLNRTSDTLLLSLSNNLDGNIRYSVRPCNHFLSSSEKSSSWTFHTFPSEKEPNDTRSVSDTLRTETIYGNLSRSDDIDLFFIPDTTVKVFYLYTYDGALCDAVIVDAEGNAVPPAAGKNENSYVVPEETLKPVHIKVSTSYSSSDGYYQIRLGNL
ncbi:MAG: hypothetical protein ACOC36_00835 [Fibrobacterota bacterium]